MDKRPNIVSKYFLLFYCRRKFLSWKIQMKKVKKKSLLFCLFLLTCRLLSTSQRRQPPPPWRRSGPRREACFWSPCPWTAAGSLQPPGGRPDRQSGTSQPFSCKQPPVRQSERNLTVGQVLTPQKHASTHIFSSSTAADAFSRSERVQTGRQADGPSLIMSRWRVWRLQVSHSGLGIMRVMSLVFQKHQHWFLETSNQVKPELEIHPDSGFKIFISVLHVSHAPFCWSQTEGRKLKRENRELQLS